MSYNPYAPGQTDEGVSIKKDEVRVWSEGYNIENPPDIKADYPQEDIERATAWVLQAFDDFIVYEPDAPDEPRLMEFDHVITEDEVRQRLIRLSSRDAIKVSMPAGTRIRHWIQADLFAKLFIPIILDDSIMKKVDTMIEYDDYHGLLHARFLRRWKEHREIF